MELNEYQDKAMSTCMDSCNNDAYGLFGLNAEVGELNDLIAKWIRKEHIVVNENKVEITHLGDEVGVEAERIAYELGDILWFVAHIAKRFGYSLEGIAGANLAKLAKRKESGTIVTHKDH